MSISIRLSHKINSIAAVGIVGVLALGGLYLAGNASQEIARSADDRYQTLREARAALQQAHKLVSDTL